MIVAAARREVPSPEVLGLTLLTGLRADLVTASFGMLAALALALLVAALVALRASSRAGSVLVRALGVAAASLTVVYVAILTVDMGYYLYSGQRLDAVFMEYVADLFGQGRQGEIRGSQVAAQTAAELGEVGTDAVPLAREILVPRARFVSARYPLVHVEQPRPSPLVRRPNVLLLFIEALDRRFLGRTIAGRRVTPFLDAIFADSVTFEHFRTN